MLTRSLLAGLVLVLTVDVASAQSKRPLRGPNQWRPCGPGDTKTGNRCAPQTFRGVDFRPACQKHDECYGKKRGTQKQCDARYLADLRSLCDAAGNPRGCYRRAMLYYRLVTLFGADAYKNG